MVGGVAGDWLSLLVLVVEVASRLWCLWGGVSGGAEAGRMGLWCGGAALYF
jgi:hypothetical protein